ncbi:MAG TPA: Hsp70 family protein [Streptosporangiaceae bacterium]|nr:Hsp70 family protein [Streptosporangiaceae bacterium]
MTDSAPSTIVGFDLGHGQTALAVAHADKDTYPAVLDLPGAVGRQHVTAVAEHPGRGVLIGEEAAAARGISQLWLGFKSPDLGEESVSRPITLFVGKLVADLRAKALIPAGPVRWVVGAPSGWAPSVRRAYARVLRKAGLTDVDVISESRAALLYARESGDVDLGAGGVDRPVLIVDIGSSTTDYTSVVGREATPLDHGNIRLGANLIDREILRYVLERHPLRGQLEEAMLDSPAERLRLELLCRRAKEDYFRVPSDRFRDDPDTRVSQMTEVATRDGYLDVVVRLRKADMDAILAAPQKALAGLSWVEAFGSDLKMALARLRKTPEVVVLTGGPSRMDFVLDVSRQAVGRKTTVIRGAEPEYAIARGLALAGRMTLKTAGFRADLKELTDFQKISGIVDEHLSELTAAMGTAVASGITERFIIPAFIKWRNGELKTLEKMSEVISEQVNDELQDGNVTALAEAIATWQQALQPEIDDLTRPICRRWGMPANALKLPEVTLDSAHYSVTVDTSAATSTMEGVGNSIAAVAAIIGGTLLGGAGTALLMAGPVGWIIGAVGVGVAALAGKDALIEKAKTSDLPLSLRKMTGEKAMVSKLRADAAASERKLATALAAEFTKNTKEEISHGMVSSILAQLEAQADEAEFLIS